MPVEPCMEGCKVALYESDLDGEVVWEGPGEYHKCSAREETCQKWKPYTHYHARTYNGHQPICKECRKELKR